MARPRQVPWKRLVSTVTEGVKDEEPTLSDNWRLFTVILLLFCKRLNFFPDLVMSLLAKSVGVSLRFGFGAALVVAIEFLQYR